MEGVLRRPDPGIGVYLVYGPDTGLDQRARPCVAERSVADPADPFQLIRLDGDYLAADPGRLTDEAGTSGCSAGAARSGSAPTPRNIAPAVDAVLKADVPTPSS